MVSSFGRATAGRLAHTVWVRWLRNLLSSIPLVLLVALTLRAQAFWNTSGGVGLLLGAVWVALMVGWGVWRHERLQHKNESKIGVLVLPACFAFVAACQITHVPLRVVFWTQKTALEKALKRAPVAREVALRRSRPQARIGWFRPLQISKSGTATCFVLWENEGFLSGTAIGFAHCPGDGGCRAASFDRFYFDSEGEPRMVQMSGDWVAVAVYGSDM